MKLSEAIRVGSQLHPMVRGAYVAPAGEDGYVDYDSQVTGTCALGAAYVGLYGKLPFEDMGPDDEVDSYIDAALQAALGIRISEVGVEFPDGAGLRSGGWVTISELAWYLNDDEEWSREQIADYLESVGY